MCSRSVCRLYVYLHNTYIIELYSCLMVYVHVKSGCNHQKSRHVLPRNSKVLNLVPPGCLPHKRPVEACPFYVQRSSNPKQQLNNSARDIQLANSHLRCQGKNLFMAMSIPWIACSFLSYISTYSKFVGLHMASMAKLMKANTWPCCHHKP